MNNRPKTYETFPEPLFRATEAARNAVLNLDRLVRSGEENIATTPHFTKAQQACLQLIAIEDAFEGRSTNPATAVIAVTVLFSLAYELYEDRRGTLAKLPKKALLDLSSGKYSAPSDHQLQAALKSEEFYDVLSRLLFSLSSVGYPGVEKPLRALAEIKKRRFGRHGVEFETQGSEGTEASSPNLTFRSQ